MEAQSSGASKSGREGFAPLRRIASTPVQGTNLSFNSNLKQENARKLWEKESWGRLEKTASFSGKQIGVSTHNKAIAVVDPMSTGLHIARIVNERGFKCIRIFAAYNSPVQSLVHSKLQINYDATIQHDDRDVTNPDANIANTINELRHLPWEIFAVIPGAETGVELADRLSDRMGLKTNGEEDTLARRNKYIMGEAVRSSGIRAVGQKLCKCMDDVLEFLRDYNPTPFKVVVKPVDSAGTDDVFLCDSRQEAMDAFTHIIGKMNYIGYFNDSVLIQEFLRGTEFVVDGVSLDGVHKTVAIWEYDKRPANGAKFVYHGQRLRSSASETMRRLVDYAHKVLNAVGIMNGPSHMEVMVCADGPCLVEVGARCQGGEGSWLPLVDLCLGYNQASLAVDVYIPPSAAWNAIPQYPDRLLKHTREVDIVSRYSGIVRNFPGDEALRKLPSYFNHVWTVNVGEFVPKTIDFFTRPGVVQLLHDSEEQADLDFEKIHILEHRGLIDYSVICQTSPPASGIVIVNPIHAGTLLAALAIKMSFKIILVFLNADDVGGAIQVVQESKNSTIVTVPRGVLTAEIVQTLQNLDIMLYAVLPGTENAVRVADELSVALGTRSNAPTISAPKSSSAIVQVVGQNWASLRTSKYEMHVKLTECGLSTWKQALCVTDEAACSFYDEWRHCSSGSRFKMVVKPASSARREMVWLCDSRNDVVTAFREIMSASQATSLDHSAACLLQEYLEGEEYHFDFVSRDACHKCVCAWRVTSTPPQVSPHSARRLAFAEQERVLMPLSLLGCNATACISTARAALDAVGTLNGPSRVEMIFTDRPNVLEITACCERKLVGHDRMVDKCLRQGASNQAQACLDVYTRPDRFDTLPMEAKESDFCGLEIEIMNRQQGKLVSLNYQSISTIQSMEGFFSLDMSSFQPGKEVVLTTSELTSVGSVQFVLPTQMSSSFPAIIERVRSLENDQLFQLVVEEEKQAAAEEGAKPAKQNKPFRRALF